MKILYVSNAIPYNSINHAGGKTFNYYVKSLQADKFIEVTVVGLCKYAEMDKFREEADKNFDCHMIATRGTVKINAIRVLTDIAGFCTFKESYSQSYYKTSQILKMLKKLKSTGYCPDVIVLEWTNIVLMQSAISQIFSDAKLVASEHDVSFQGAERRYLLANGKERDRLKRNFLNLKQRELNSLAACNVIMPQNFKDRELLIQNGIPAHRIHVLTPYYHNMSKVKRSNINHDILFWGAMYREENYSAALWFIDNVMPLLEETDVRFIVVGNMPPEVLIKRKNERIVVTGFVEDEVPLFEHSLCFVSPLLLGAGIKVKVIEAMSAGIPVLTNEIGIEGIPAVDGISYYYCKTAEDYAKRICSLIKSEELNDRMSCEERKLIQNSFDLNVSAKNYKEMLIRLSLEQI